MGYRQGINTAIAIIYESSGFWDEAIAKIESLLASEERNPGLSHDKEIADLKSRLANVRARRDLGEKVQIDASQREQTI